MPAVVIGDDEDVDLSRPLLRPSTCNVSKICGIRPSLVAQEGTRPQILPDALGASLGRSSLNNRFVRLSVSNLLMSSFFALERGLVPL
jgi:hypothetical protein